MKKELKEKWVAALRSGEYKQGKNILRSAYDEYCCLGVLCDVAGLTCEKNEDGHYSYTYRKRVFSNDSIPPWDFQEISNISDNQTGALTNLNDIQEKDFNYIADYIEKNIKAV